MNLAKSLVKRSRKVEKRYSLEDWFKDVQEAFIYGGHLYPASGTLAQDNREGIADHFEGLVLTAYRQNGVVFACMLARMMVFSAPRFQYQRLERGRPTTLFGDQSLSLLEQPWPGGTTQDLLTRAIQDADLAGNSYWVRQGDELVRLRPDWVSIVLEERQLNGGRVGYRRAGYVYQEGGERKYGEPVPFLPTEVAHFAPIPDPLANYRGMSWLTPVVREIRADKRMQTHREKFFENGATPNMVVKFDPQVSIEVFKQYKEEFLSEHQGTSNAYKTLFLGGGSDATVVGSDFEQMDFRQVGGWGETRIAAASGVPPVIVGLSEGLQAATYSNYGQARRRFADGTIWPLWTNAAGSFQQIVPVPQAARLWVDARNVPFLREDSKDEAEIFGRKSQAVRTLTDGGFTPESVVAAVDALDLSLLEHTKLFSVQLQPPDSGSIDDESPDPDAEDDDQDGASQNGESGRVGPAGNGMDRRSGEVWAGTGGNGMASR